jgi:predicted metal-dependent hydrolase
VTNISYQLRRSARARRLRITVRPGGVEVVAPIGMREAAIAAFVEHHRPWVQSKLSVLQARLAAHPGPSRLLDGGTISYRGRPVELRVRAGARRSQVLERDGIEVIIPTTVDPAVREAAVVRALTRWLAARARTDAEEHVARHGPPHGLIPSAIRIKAQKRLWGSCTANGAINLNWRLILAPPPVFEYVAVHELCHLRERHHQAVFWRLVGKVLPGFEQPRRWLRDNGHLLTLKPGELD